MTQTPHKTPTLEDHLLRLEIEDFLWTEAELLDEFRYEEWLDLLTDDLVYWMPIRRNVPSREMEGGARSCAAQSCAYRPSARRRSSCVPSSTIEPC